MAAILPTTDELGAAESPPPRRNDPIRTVLVVTGILALVFLVLTLGFLAWHAITWIFVALFFAMALNPAVVRLEALGMARGPAAAVVFVLAAALAGGFAYLLVPPLVRQVVDLVEALPALIEELDRGRGPFGWVEREFGIVDRAQAALEEGGAGAVLGMTRPAIGVLETIVTTIFGVFAVAFLTFFMLLDGRRWVGLWLDFVPAPSRPRWERVFAGVYRTIGGYVTGNLLISFAAGAVSTATLYAVGVPYALPLGLLVAILDLIPLVGATVATVVVGLVALAEGWVPALIVVVVLVVYQQIENHVLQPLVYGRTVQLSPLAILISVLIGAELAGVLGALAAIPVGGSIIVVVGEILRWRRETRIETPPGTGLAASVPDEEPS